MAYTQAQIDKLDAAIASGVTTVRNANGETIIYRSLAEMKQARAMMVAGLAGTVPARRVSGFYPRFTRFPCDDTAG